jgi:hypothetical protein
MKAKHEPNPDGNYTLAIQLASRLVGPNEENLLNNDDDFVAYA